MIPAAHMLGHPRRWRGLYVATCACGWDVYGLRLPAVWQRHQMHLDAVRNAAQTRHPSRRSDSGDGGVGR